MLRRLVDWLHRRKAVQSSGLAEPERMTPMDVDEFARLLQSGRPEDMKLIARTFGHEKIGI